MATRKKSPTRPNAPILPVVPDQGEQTVLERQTQKVEPPKRYQVVVLNDDYTPMEFVVEVIVEFFGKTREAATQIMLTIHEKGRGICGLYARDIAETKADQVLMAAHHAGHPLQCISEPVPD
jgi:ATP-dependent Clp protease adaptor protein ClpS